MGEIKFPSLEVYSGIADYLKQQSYSEGRKYYCHYTTLKNAESILKNNEIWLSSVKKFNDREDAKQFDVNKHYFAFCLCSQKLENIPMWYLYSGMNGKGARLRFTINKIKKLIEEGTYELYDKNDDTVLTSIPIDAMKITFQDVIYVLEKTSGAITLKCNGINNRNFDNTILTKLKNKNIGFIKDYLWNYEKEIRLVVQITDDDIISYFKTQKEYVIKLKPKTGIIATGLDFAPEIEEQSQEIKGVLKTLETKKMSSNYSKYQGIVKMNLCRDCDYRLRVEKKL